MYEFDEADEGARSRGRVAVAAAAVVALAAVGWFVVRPRLSGDDETTTARPASSAPADSSAATGATGDDRDDAATATTDEPSTDRSSSPTPSQPADTAVETTASSVTGPTTVEITATTGAPVTTEAPATTEAPPTTAAPTTVAAVEPTAPPFNTLPDGTPQPIEAIYDAAGVRLTGSVPDQAAMDLLAGLALANHRTPETAELTNLLTINPAVPRGIGVRVIETTSTRFPEGSAEVLPPHAAELDRVVRVMELLPKITVLVVGHSDQRGEEGSNFQLSAARAASVVNYMVGRGVAGTRLASRAVGEDDLLTLNDDAAALALNRRTEFIIYGLLLG